MAQKTGIEWTDESSNPLRYRNKAGKDVWGCIKVSAGCAHCYAEAIALRFERGGPFTKSKMEELEPYVSDAEIGKLLRSQKLAGKRVFLCDMTDCFGEWVLDDLLDTLFAVMALRPDVTFQVLTKRAHWMRTYMTKAGRAESVAVAATNLLGPGPVPGRIEDAFVAQVLWTGANASSLRPAGLKDWPLPNVWLGVSTENQDAADKRIPDLLKTPAAVRFLSVEPLLGPVELVKGKGWLSGIHGYLTKQNDGGSDDNHIDWVIVGGESGQGARPCEVEWIRSLVKQCKTAGVACFVKQLGSNVHAINAIDPLDQFPGSPSFRQGPREDTAIIRLNSHKGNDMDEWPDDLQVRQFPGEVAK